MSASASWSAAALRRFGIHRLTVHSRDARSPNLETAHSHAFSRVDLIALIAALGILATWFAITRTGERGRVARCAHNLGVLGGAIQSYANEHSDDIPAAGINLGSTKATWDTDLFAYLKPGLAKSNGAYEQRQLMLAVQKWFACPSDPLERGGTPRSYAMSGRDMTLNWPPTPRDRTGIGLWWDNRTVALLGSNAEQTIKSESLPRIKLSMLPDPAGTFLLTELIQKNNIMGSDQGLRVFSFNQQMAPFNTGLTEIHYGRFNYLMADGHAELFTKLQTGGIGREPAGIWTIKAAD